MPTLLDDVDPFVEHAAAKRPTPERRPWVAALMVASVDGATAVDGRSGGLGGPADKAVFSALRAATDVILVGAGTARAEAYRAPRTAPVQQAARAERGQAPFPRLAVVTRSLDLDPEGPMFTDLPDGPDVPERPLIYTVSSAPAKQRAALEAVSEVIDAGTESVDLVAVLGDLARRDVPMALAEGGPTLLGQLLSEGLIDEINITTAPLLVGGTSARLMTGAQLSAPADLALAHLWEDDGFLLARYVGA